MSAYTLRAKARRASAQSYRCEAEAFRLEGKGDLADACESLARKADEYAETYEQLAAELGEAE